MAINQNYSGLSDKQLQTLEMIILKGMENSRRVLSEMTHSTISLDSLNAGLVPLKDIPSIAGGAETEVVAIYLSITHDVTGHMMLLFPFGSAFDLADMLLENPPGTTDEMSDIVYSALGEVGNVVGSFFLNAMADTTGLTICPSPPEVAVDMVGAVLSMILAEVATQADEAFLVETSFTENTREIKGFFLLVPSSGSLETILNALGVDN